MCPGDADSCPSYSLPRAIFAKGMHTFPLCTNSGALIAAFAGLSAFLILLGGMKPAQLRRHMTMGTLGASISAARSAKCTLCPKTMEYLNKIRSGFSSTLDHSKKSPQDAAVFYVDKMRTKVVPIKECTYFDYLQDSYNEKPVDPLYRPGLLSYIWRLAACTYVQPRPLPVCERRCS